MIRRLGFAALGLGLALVVAGCSGGRSRRLADGQWYGKLTAVNVAEGNLTFAPACRFNELGRWIAVAHDSRAPTVIAVSPRADLAIYYRPRDPARGHGQPADLTLLADVVLHGRLPTSPPGWFVTVRDGAAVLVEEDSGVRSSGKADKRAFACVWSARTQAFVSR
jgi:hypothetical protein